jgi:hypothetical protein
VTQKTVTDKLVQAKQAVRLAKAELKKARKLYKAAKKAAKKSGKARKQVKTRKPVKARATLRPAVKPKAKATPPVRAKRATKVKRATPPPVVAKRVVPKMPRTAKARAPEMRSTEEITKTVIERLQSPPPVLPPDAVIPEG